MNFACMAGVDSEPCDKQNCQHKFEQTASDPRLRFIGNCKIGLQESSTPLTPSISLEQLQKHYDAILLTYGASRDRTLNIPGEATLKNILSARSFVHFYNGYPVSQDVQWPDLSKVSNVTIVGQGNVALDCARMLLSPVDDLAKTDAPDSALAELARSQVKHVSLVGRRGALQFAGTTKELREMMQLPGVKFQANAHELSEAEQTLSQYGSAIKNARMKKRLLGLMQEGSETQLGDRDWSLQFFKSPTAFLGEESVRAVEWERNELVKDPDQDPSSWRVKGTNQTTKTPADLVLTSIGYRSVPVPGVPFDGMAGVVKNVNGRVVSEAGSAVRPPMHSDSQAKNSQTCSYLSWMPGRRTVHVWLAGQGTNWGVDQHHDGCLRNSRDRGQRLESAAVRRAPGA